jgi:hypothetical protein
MLNVLSSKSLLEALDGIAYLIGPDSIILGVGERNWSAFAQDNLGADLTPDRVVGRSLFDFILGDDVKDAYRAFHAELNEGVKPRVEFLCRCDSPATARDLHVSLRPVSLGEDTGILYQCQVLSTTMRPPVHLIDPDRWKTTASGAPRSIVRICSYCSNIAWPPGEAGGSVVWISATEYYRRGGGDEVLLSHGICPDCHKRIVEPELTALRAARAASVAG